MKVAIHADPAVHAIPGGIGVYVRRLIKQLRSEPGAGDYRLIVSKFAEAPANWDDGTLIRPRMPVAPLYASWNFSGRPRIPGDLDVVHATALAIPPAAGAKLVATVHDLVVEKMPETLPATWRRVYRQGLTRALEEASVLCAVSQSTADELIARGVDASRIVVTPLAPNTVPGGACNDLVFDRLALDGPYILAVGTVEPRKNYEALVRAFAAAADRLGDHRLVIAGFPGWGQEKLAALIESLGMTARVTTAGKVGPGELVSLYTRADVFAIPSWYEGFGLPLCEALAFGIPSLASTTPALREVGGDAAEYVEPSDHEALAEALVKLASDQQLRDRLSRSGPERAGEFTWERTAEATRSAYAAAISG